MTRITRRPDGRMAIGRSEPGRGAWLCTDAPECFRDAQRRNAFARALRAPVTDEQIEQLFVRLYGGSGGEVAVGAGTGSGESRTTRAVGSAERYKR
jgi:predicted RNA-binding protein YlxR (DUF448 family)